jgi:TRAP-type C4-dicarboxylate transport system, periplasmic component
MKKIVYYSVLAGFLSSFGALSARAQTVWSMPTEYPATAMPGEGVTTFAEAIAKRLPGKLVIKPSYNAESGFKSADLPGAVAGGKVQAADAFSGAMGKLDPAFELASLPFLASTLEDARRLGGGSTAVLREGPCGARAQAALHYALAAFGHLVEGAGRQRRRAEQAGHPHL